MVTIQDKAIQDNNDYDDNSYDLTILFFLLLNKHGLIEKLEYD